MCPWGSEHRSVVSISHNTKKKDRFANWTVLRQRLPWRHKGSTFALRGLQKCVSAFRSGSTVLPEVSCWSVSFCLPSGAEVNHGAHYATLDVRILASQSWPGYLFWASISSSVISLEVRFTINNSTYHLLSICHMPSIMLLSFIISLCSHYSPIK